MARKRIYIALLTLCLALCVQLFAAEDAHALLVWDWSFNASVIETNGRDTVFLNATLFNDITSDENITSSLIRRASFSGSGKYYWFAFGPGSENAHWFKYPYFESPNNTFFTQFDGMDLAPGESYDFVFGRRIPLYGCEPLAKGWHVPSSPPAVGRVEKNMCTLYIDGVWKYGYTEMHIIHTPEPATLILFGIGLLGTGAYKRAKRKRGIIA